MSLFCVVRLLMMKANMLSYETQGFFGRITKLKEVLFGGSSGYPYVCNACKCPITSAACTLQEGCTFLSDWTSLVIGLCWRTNFPERKRLRAACHLDLIM